MRKQFKNAVIFLNLFSFAVAKSDDKDDDDYIKFLSDAFQEDVNIRRAQHKHSFSHKSGKDVGKPFRLPGDYSPLPGRSTDSDYWPLYPMLNQYMAAVTYDTSHGRHSGGDINVPIPWWGFLDIGGHFIERFQDYWTKIGYNNNPINMLGLRRDQIIKLMSDPSLHYNRNTQPNLPVAALPRNYVPLSCKPPMCNPYTNSIGVGVEANVHIEDGVEGEIDLPIPIGKKIGLRLPVSGNAHYDVDDISITYGQNLHPVDPFLFSASEEFPTKYRKNKE